jgi:2-polyprenyl-3-methyl-5-hydroxy-6-metoxy-1,4-benzoquinol methylase
MPLRLRRGARPEPAAPAPETPRDPEAQWWHDHYEWAVGEVIDFVVGAGGSLEGATVADVGCGDGIIDLGLAVRAKPARLVGYDLRPTDTALLLERSRRQGGPAELPGNLEFAATEPLRIPAGDATYDAVVTWSAFEHVRDPVAVLREVRRVLKPGGLLFLQLWPFYHSERGSHLWDWFPEGFHHLDRTEEEIAEAMRASDRQERLEYMLGEYRTLNRIDLDGLQRAVLAGGFGITQVELVSHRVMIPPRLMRYPLSQLAIGGVKLLATPL